MRIAICGDTHVPSRAEEIPAWVEEELEDADHVLFTGDFDSEGAYERVGDVVGETLTAVAGNVDPPELALPDVATVDLGGVTFVLTHGTGEVETWESRVADAVREHAGGDAVGVAGHSHEVVDTEFEGVRLLNPGSATAADPADRETMMVAEAEDGDVEVRERHEGRLR